MEFNLKTEVMKAFDVQSLPPPLLPADQSYLGNWECKELLLRLMGTKWIDASTPSSFWAICPSSEVWSVCLPASWYQYFLPAMLLIADGGTDARAENLRGSLLRAIERAPVECANSKENFCQAFDRLNATQKEVVQKFFAKYKD